MRDVTLMGLTTTVWMFFCPFFHLVSLYKEQRSLMSFIYVHSFMSDVQMGVNKGRWEGTGYCATTNTEIFVFDPVLFGE